MNIFNSRRKSIITSVSSTLNISRKEAVKRVDALLKSDIMEDGSPGDRMTQLIIENFLRFDLSKLDYKDVFTKTLHFPELIAEYDEREDRQLAKVLKALFDKEPVAPQFAKEEIEAFDYFFCHKIWNRFPGVTKYDQ